MPDQHNTGLCGGAWRRGVLRACVFALTAPRETGALDTSLPFDELRARSVVNERTRAAGGSPEFSALLRAGVPGMGQPLKGGD